MDEYNDAVACLNRLLSEPTSAAPGPLSLMLLSPFNSSWKWDEKNYNITVREVWSDENVMSELRIPITTDSLISLLAREINEERVTLNNGEPDYVRDYQKSISNLAEDPCKVLKILAQMLGGVDVPASMREPDRAFLEREIDDFRMLLLPRRDDRHHDEIVREKVEYLRKVFELK